MINRAEAEKFLKALDSAADKFTFQTFDDKNKKKDRTLERIFHGTLDQHWEKLVDLNKRGASINVTINETDFKGRKTENIKRVRYVFVDLDGNPLEPAKEPRPHIIVESSPKRWHVYWRITDMPLSKFSAAQKKLIKRLKGDKKITDLPRVLRLPGTIHQKGKPFRTRIVDIWDGKPYKSEKFINHEIATPVKKARSSNLPPVDEAEINAALNVLPSDDYQIWLEVGAALYKELGDEKGFPVFDRWSRKSEKYDKQDCERKWEECAKLSKSYSAGTIFHYATEAEPTWRELDAIPEGATIDDFISYLPGNDYIYVHTGQHWGAKPVNSRMPKQQVGNKYVKATDYLDRNRRAEAMTWAPGEPMMMADRLARVEGGWVDVPGTTCFNAYRPPVPKGGGDPKLAKQWIDHVRRLYPNEAEHLLSWFAQRVQFPGVKINHGLIIGGEQGIGKDMILKPVRNAVGIWNTVSVAPKDIMSSFNTYVRSVICQVDEARDLGDTRHIDFYEHLKTLAASPPDVLQCNEKHVSPYGVMNCTGVVITTNHRTGGIYLPPGDRRFYVAWSDCHKTDFSTAYFDGLEAFYNNGGYGHVLAFLQSYNVSAFNPKAPPPQTEAWHDIVEAGLPMEDAEFAEALTILGKPDAVTTEQIMRITPSNSFAKWLEERRNYMKFAHRLESCGYVSVRNPESGGHNRWRYTISKNNLSARRETAIYARSELSIPARVRAAKELILKIQSGSSDL